jgi:hypothetical protein
MCISMIIVAIVQRSPLRFLECYRKQPSYQGHLPWVSRPLLFSNRAPVRLEYDYFHCTTSSPNSPSVSSVPVVPFPVGSNTQKN